MSNHLKPLVAPFRIFADFREESEGWQFKELYDAAQPARGLVVPIEYRSLEYGDYTVEGLPLFFVRKNAKDFVAAIHHRPRSVEQELKQLQQLEAIGASCLVVLEGDVDEAEQVLAQVKAFGYGEDIIAWLFAPTRSTAELIVFAVIQHAWLNKQAS
jgi:ERCC4-type nuclease